MLHLDAPSHWVEVYSLLGMAHCSGGSKKIVIRLRLSAGRDVQGSCAPTSFVLTRDAAKCSFYSLQALLLCWP